MESLKYTGENPTLREMFANLIANSMDSETAKNAHPAFVDIIKSMTSDEAKILKSFIPNVYKPIMDVKLKMKKGTKGEHNLLENYSAIGLEAGCEHLDLVPNYIDNLCRLGLLTMPAGRHLVGDTAYDILTKTPEYEAFKEKHETDHTTTRELKKYIELTKLGSQFREACKKETSVLIETGAHTHFSWTLCLIMDLYWRNILEETGIDNHLEIEISNSEKPAIKLMSGTNLQFKIVKDSNDLLWGRIASDYYGCWALTSKNNWMVDEMPIPPATVEESKSQPNKERIEFWSKYFLNELKRSKSSFLFDGTWELTEAKKKETITNHSNWRMIDYDFTINDQQPIRVDWDFGKALKVIRLKAWQHTETGRIKWWKKKVAEESCPPILTWFVASLDSLVVIDGHDRLSAYEALNIQPQFLIINSVRKEPKEVDRAKQQGILDSLAKRNLNPEKKGLTVERLNYLLLDAFDDNPFRRPISKGNGKSGLSDSWIKEVSNFKLDSSIDQEELEAMLVGD